MVYYPAGYPSCIKMPAKLFATSSCSGMVFALDVLNQVHFLNPKLAYYIV